MVQCIMSQAYIRKYRAFSYNWEYTDPTRDPESKGRVAT